MMANKTIYLISCVSEKLKSTAPAMNMYQSQWFKKAWRYAVYHHFSWCGIYILSAKHGLLTPQQLIAPYEKTLNTMKIVERKQWAEMVIAQLKHKERFEHVTNVVFLAGKKYREFLQPMLEEMSGVATHVPMEGLGIGQQLAYLDKHRTIAEGF